MSDKIRIISDKFELDDIAESVREKTKLTGKMSLGQIAHNIRRMAGIGQGILTTDATIESGDQMLEGVTAYGASGIVTGTIPSQEATNIIPNDDEQIAIPAGTYAEGDVTVSPVPTETMSISSNGTYIPEDGKYFSSVNVNVNSAGGSFETQSKTVTPTESRQTVFPDTGYDGLSNVIIEAIPNEYVTTTDATATSEHIFLDETAYVNGEKITGTFTIDEEVITQESLIDQIQAALEGKTAGGGVTPPEYSTQTSIINYKVGTTYSGSIKITYLTVDDNGFVKWEQTEKLTGEGTINIESLSRAWLYIECTQTNFFMEYGLSIEMLSYSDETPYKVVYPYGDGAYGVVAPSYEYNVSFTSGAGE